MPLELTEQQRRMVEGEAGQPVEVVDPDTQRTYFLIGSEQFEKVRPFLDDAPQPATPSDAGSVAISPEMLRSQHAFWRDLPELLKQRKLRKRWVCYCGDERIGIAKTKTELVQRCLLRGLQRGQFYVGWIEERFTPPWEPTELEVSLFEATDFRPAAS
jgi:hypothetical protein